MDNGEAGNTPMTSLNKISRFLVTKMKAHGEEK